MAELAGAERGEAADGAVAEELVHGEFADELPVGFHGGEGHGGAIGEAVYGGGVNAGGEGELVGLEELSGEFRRGDDDARDVAEAEGE